MATIVSTPTPAAAAPEAAAQAESAPPARDRAADTAFRLLFGPGVIVAAIALVVLIMRIAALSGPKLTP